MKISYRNCTMPFFAVIYLYLQSLNVNEGKKKSLIHAKSIQSNNIRDKIVDIFADL